MQFTIIKAEADLAVVRSGNKFICAKTELRSVKTVNTSSRVVKVIKIFWWH